MASIIVHVVVILLDVIAFGLTVAVEKHRSKVTVTPDLAKEYDYCVYDSDVTTGYSVGALLVLAAAQVVVMLASRYFCCGRGPKPRGCERVPSLLQLTSVCY